MRKRDLSRVMTGRSLICCVKIKLKTIKYDWCVSVVVFNIQSVILWPFHAVIPHKLITEFAEIVLCCLCDGGLWKQSNSRLNPADLIFSAAQRPVKASFQQTCIFLTLNVAFLCLWNILLHKQVLSKILFFGFWQRKSHHKVHFWAALHPLIEWNNLPQQMERAR